MANAGRASRFPPVPMKSCDAASRRLRAVVMPERRASQQSVPLAGRSGVTGAEPRPIMQRPWASERSGHWSCFAGSPDPAARAEEFAPPLEHRRSTSGPRRIRMRLHRRHTIQPARPASVARPSAADLLRSDGGLLETAVARTNQSSACEDATRRPAEPVHDHGWYESEHQRGQDVGRAEYQIIRGHESANRADDHCCPERYSYDHGRMLEFPPGGFHPQ